MEFLLRLKYNDIYCNDIKTLSELLQFMSMKAYDTDLQGYAVYALHTTDCNLTPLTYRGWQPDGLIEFVDNDDNVVIHEYINVY